MIMNIYFTIGIWKFKVTFSCNLFVDKIKEL